MHFNHGYSLNFVFISSDIGLAVFTEKKNKRAKPDRRFTALLYKSLSWQGSPGDTLVPLRSGIPEPQLPSFLLPASPWGAVPIHTIKTCSQVPCQCSSPREEKRRNQGALICMGCSNRKPYAGSLRPGGQQDRLPGLEIPTCLLYLHTTEKPLVSSSASKGLNSIVRSPPT